MPWLSIIISILVVVLILWLLNAYAPIPKKVKNIINIVVIILLIIWLLRAFGILNI
jgi:uncharacterized protein YhhL (DUF1145 family)